MEIIYEDDNILAINKPAGVVVHRDSHHESGTLVDEILEKYPEIKGVGDDSERPGIVHRLDKDTSGIILIAKNQLAFEFLKKQFQERKIEKYYRVLVVGEVKDREGIIDLPIGRSFVNPTKRVARGKMRGKIREARTKYGVLNKFEGFTYLEASPKTGRTHQIRSHFAAIDHPVVCVLLQLNFAYPPEFQKRRVIVSSLKLKYPRICGKYCKNWGKVIKIVDYDCSFKYEILFS
ncbi:MAG: Pseudouridylate synthase RluA [Parcubacteria group bacterium GW2011_GWF1_40_5]|nr:MAG: Pseudouridylate synthase RluA [Parcubacteria group bacterium GW2011_GWF1_40_5]